MKKNMHRRVVIAKNWPFETYGAGSLLVLTCVNAPIRDAFDCSLRKPMRQHCFRVSRGLLSLSQEKSSGVEIERLRVTLAWLAKRENKNN